MGSIAPDPRPPRPLGPDAEARHVGRRAGCPIARQGAAQATRLGVEAGGHLELLTDASILFPDSHVETTTTVTLAEGASAILAESFLWHDPKGGDTPRFTLMAASVEASGADGRLLVLDRYRIERPRDDEASRAFWRAALPEKPPPCPA